MIEDYCRRRDHVLKEISDEYSVSRKIAKKLVLRLCFFGTFRGWCVDQNLSNATESLWFTNVVRELGGIAKALKDKNPFLYESARKSKEVKNKTKNVIGSFFALYLQEWELRIVEKIISWLVSNTDVMKHPNGKTSYPVGVYEYDGIKLLKENVDKFEGGKEGLRLKIIEKKRAHTPAEPKYSKKSLYNDSVFSFFTTFP